MSAGKILEEVERISGRASGRIITMIVKQKVSRSELQTASLELKQAASAIDRLLDPKQGR